MIYINNILPVLFTYYISVFVVLLIYDYQSDTHIQRIDKLLLIYDESNYPKACNTILKW